MIKVLIDYSFNYNTDKQRFKYEILRNEITKIDTLYISIHTDYIMKAQS